MNQSLRQMPIAYAHLKIANHPTAKTASPPSPAASPIAWGIQIQESQPQALSQNQKAGGCNPAAAHRQSNHRHSNVNAGDRHEIQACRNPLAGDPGAKTVNAPGSLARAATCRQGALSLPRYFHAARTYCSALQPRNSRVSENFGGPGLISVFRHRFAPEVTHA